MAAGKSTKRVSADKYNPTLRRISALMKERGWNEHRLATEAELPSSSIRNLYDRNSEPKLDTLRAICRAFDVSLSDFFSEECNPPRHDYSNDERRLILSYRELHRNERRILFSYIDGLCHRARATRLTDKTDD